MNTMDTAESSDAPLSSALSSVAYVLFGDALPMQALRHVLKTLDLVVLEPDEALKTGKEFRVVFDGRDAQACRKKAEFMLSLGSPVLMFPLGKVPNIGPLFEIDRTPPPHQGTIFDPKVEEFARIWGCLHFPLARFVEQTDSTAAKAILPDASIVASNTLNALDGYASTQDEKTKFKQVITLIKRVEALVAGWSALKASSDTAELERRQITWTTQIRPHVDQTRPGPLSDFRTYICGLGNAGGNFATTVPRLMTMKPATLAGWQNQLDQLQ